MSQSQRIAPPLEYHLPVMMDEVFSFLLTDHSGCYVDATLGGGGHASALLAQLNPDAILIGIDTDPDAVSETKKRLGGDSRVIIAFNNFSQIKTVLSELSVAGCNGILADLGVSSYQINTAERGFSYMKEGPLDMRMNPGAGLSAADLIAQTDEKELADLIFRYGEERHSRKIARRIKAVQQKKPITTTQALVDTIESILPMKARIKSLARVFQALRIAVNMEMAALETFLPSAFDALKMGGRLVVISYHSLEDRQVKRFMVEKCRTCICPPGMPICTCQHTQEGRLLTRKAIASSEEEVKNNPRARSAKLRAIEKIID